MLSLQDALYGTLDPNTREWTDGLFTHVLRKIIDNVRNELDKRQWIIFDGDVDPEWVENLNSVLLCVQRHKKRSFSGTRRQQTTDSAKW